MFSCEYLSISSSCAFTLIIFYSIHFLVQILKFNHFSQQNSQLTPLFLETTFLSNVYPLFITNIYSATRVPSSSRAESVRNIHYKRIHVILVQFIYCLSYNNLLLSYNTKTNKMSNLNLSDTQSSQFSKQEEQPPLAGQLTLLTQEIDPEQAKAIVKKIAQSIKTAKGEKFELLMSSIIKLISKGYAREFFKFQVIMVAMQKEFCTLCRRIQSDSKAEGKMIYILSAIAEMIRQGGKCDFAFTEKFLKNLFLIDQELLEESSYKDSILAILGVVYQNISRQGRLLNKYGMVREFKQVVLANYRLVSQGFSARLFNKCLYNIAIQGLSLSQAELHKYKVFDTLSKFLAPAQVATLIQKIRKALSEVSPKKVQVLEPQTQMIAQL